MTLHAEISWTQAVVAGERSVPPHNRNEKGNEERGVGGNGRAVGLGFPQQISDANDSGDA